MTTEKLKQCRICLAKNVRMIVIANKNLQETYEKLTNVPFVTEDRRPMFTCLLCCSKLKQLHQLRSMCLEAEKLFDKMLNDKSKTKPVINQGLLEFRSGLAITPTKNLSLTESKEEHQSGALKPENLDNSCINAAHHSESDSEDDVPITEFKIEVEEEQLTTC